MPETADPAPAKVESAPTKVESAPASTPEPTGAGPESMPPMPPTRSAWQRALLIALAGVSLALAIIGVFLPGLPTTPFLLVAAWASARSSPRLHAWLHRHRVFGPMLRDWRDGRRVARRSKIAAALSMAAAALLMIYTLPHAWVVWPACISMAVVLCWLWSRPE